LSLRQKLFVEARRRERRSRMTKGKKEQTRPGSPSGNNAVQEEEEVISRVIEDAVARQEAASWATENAALGNKLPVVLFLPVRSVPRVHTGAEPRAVAAAEVEEVMAVVEAVRVSNRKEVPMVEPT